MAATVTTAGTVQPVIRGIQAVGSVNITYIYNSSDHKLILPENIITIQEQDQNGSVKGTAIKSIDTSKGLTLVGFRLDSQFLQAAQQIASSAVIPILGGGGLALTNNNRTGSLQINCTRVGVPGSSTAAIQAISKGTMGLLAQGSNSKAASTGWDMSLIAQIQQAQDGGDSCGATMTVDFQFMGYTTEIQFEGVTVANVAPVKLAGNDASDYGVQLNYLNWSIAYGAATEA